ncbi:MAG: hypothetical protein WD824_18290 [Cyclobacteriaceae bacterium]
MNSALISVPETGDADGGSRGSGDDSDGWHVTASFDPRVSACALRDPSLAHAYQKTIAPNELLHLNRKLAMKSLLFGPNHSETQKINLHFPGLLFQHTQTGPEPARPNS